MSNEQNDRNTRNETSSFIDYNSSQIVPQKALLMKFNKLIDYLLDNEFMPEENIITEEDISELFE